MLHFGGAIRAIACFLPGILAACAGNDVGFTTVQSGLGCVDDSPQCIASRQSALRTLVDDKNRTWVKERPTPEAYASGVRLFAYKTKKKELSCDELVHARMEAEAADASLNAARHKLTPAQISRSRMLAGEIGRELGKEHSRRCSRG